MAAVFSRRMQAPPQEALPIGWSVYLSDVYIHLRSSGERAILRTASSSFVHPSVRLSVRWYVRQRRLCKIRISGYFSTVAISQTGSKIDKIALRSPFLKESLPVHPSPPPSPRYRTYLARSLLQAMAQSGRIFAWSG